MTEIVFIEQVLEATSALVRGKYVQRAQIEVTSKSEANDLLTEVDLAVQDHIVDRIRHQFPADFIAAEERDFAHFPDDPACRCWVIDPIDGTQDLVRGLFPTFGISVAFAAGGTVMAGGVSLPIPHDVFLAERGAGSFRNGRRVQVSTVDQVATARIEIDFSGRGERPAILERATEIIRSAGQIRCNCATVVALCSIASGDMEGFFHVTLNPWDYAAGQILVEEAGGVTSRLGGGPLRLFDGNRGVLASNGHIHQELLSLIKSG